MKDYGGLLSSGRTWFLVWVNFRCFKLEKTEAAFEFGGVVVLTVYTR